jgi:tetratricopeptide (TPR) repeat protein
MPEKKPIRATQSSDRSMTKPQPVASVKSADPAQAPLPPLSNGKTQMGSFEAAMKLFHTRNLKQARELFEEAAQGPERDIANRSRLHIAMCNRRLEQENVILTSAEDYYAYGIALLNSRNIPEAKKHLEEALRMAPEADHIHYAMAAAQVLHGDLNGAHEHLKRAIEIEPRNRLQARQDTDFAHLSHQPPFDSLLYPEKKSW